MEDVLLLESYDPNGDCLSRTQGDFPGADCTPTVDAPSGRTTQYRREGTRKPPFTAPVSSSGWWMSSVL